MDAVLQDEINLLNVNSEQVKSSHVYDLMIFSIKGKQRCEEQRKKFVLSRSLPIQKMYDPSTIQPEAESFLNCYTEMVQNSRKNCESNYKKVYECLSKNDDIEFKMDRFPKDCVAPMEDFMFC